MDGDLGGFAVKPDQMQVVNPLLIIILIPVFETTLYPLFRKLNIFQKPLNKMILGGMLAAVAFILSALVELAIKPTSAVLPVVGEAQVRLLNTFNCPMQIEFDNGAPVKVEALAAFENLHVAAQGSPMFNVKISPDASCPTGLTVIDRQIPLTENEVIFFQVSYLRVI
jgi:solute carrier family 15 (oligopeptide transporter), member 1